MISGPVLYWKFDSSKDWNVWNAHYSDAPYFLDECRGFPPRTPLRAASLDVGFSDRYHSPDIRMRLDAPGGPTLVFTGGRLDLDATLRQSPQLNPIPFPRERVIEFASSLSRELFPVQAGRWTPIWFGCKPYRVRGAFGDRNPKVQSLDLDAVDETSPRPRAHMQLGEWKVLADGVICRIQPSLPAGSELRRANVIDPIAAGKFAYPPYPVDVQEAWLSPDGRIMVVNGWFPLDLFDARTGRFLARTEHIADVEFHVVSTVTFSPDSAYMTALYGRLTVTWDTRTGKAIDAFQRGSFDGAIAYSGPDEVVTCFDGLMRFRSAHAWRNIHRSFPCPAGIKALAVSPDGTRLAAGNWRGQITVWDLSATRVLRSWQAYDANFGDVGQLIFSPDSHSLLVERAFRPTISIWSLDSGAHTGSLDGHVLSFESAAGSGPPVVWLDRDGEIRVHRADGTRIRTIRYPGGVPLGAHGEILQLPGAHFQKWTPQTGAIDYLLTITSQKPAAHDWIVTHPGTAVYSSSESGDEHAYLRVGPYLSNLRRYRAQFRRD